tara:strand:+ start:133 stop:537 length:405 start_codon:yes stop_codon:yes gene_type:complete
MAGIAVVAQIVKGLAVIKRLQNPNVKSPAEDGVRKIAIRLEAETKKATVVDTGRLRASITHRPLGMGAEVGSNVKYASFVEYGTDKMAARHMEGGRKVLGLGMLGYALGVLKSWVADQGSEIAKKIADSIAYGR